MQKDSVIAFANSLRKSSMQPMFQKFADLPPLQIFKYGHTPWVTRIYFFKFIKEAIGALLRNSVLKIYSKCNVQITFRKKAITNHFSTVLNFQKITSFYRLVQIYLISLIYFSMVESLSLSCGEIFCKKIRMRCGILLKTCISATFPSFMGNSCACVNELFRIYGSQIYVTQSLWIRYYGLTHFS